MSRPSSVTVYSMFLHGQFRRLTLMEHVARVNKMAVPNMFYCWRTTGDLWGSHVPFGCHVAVRSQGSSSVNDCFTQIT